MDVRLLSTVFTTVFLAEISDKTQLATVLFSARAENSRMTVFLGAAAGLLLASAIGVAAGAVIGRVANVRTLSIVAGVGFILIGAWTIYRA